MFVYLGTISARSVEESSLGGRSKKQFHAIFEAIMSLWKTVRIFISSTFRDMHSERDYLVRVVFPELKDLCAKRQLHVVDVDLRWGVTEEDSKEGKALEVCLEEIERCRPFFIGLLGERYGWVPPTYRVPNEPQYEWLRDQAAGHSVTALEIYQGVLHNPEMRSRGLFYFRDPTFLSSVPEALRSDFLSESPEAERKLRALKDEIERACQVFKYPCRYAGTDDDRKVRLVGLEAFGQQVLNDLWSAITLEYPESATPPDDLAIERSYHETFVEERAGSFIGRNNILDELNTRVEAEERTPIVVTGAAGSGKSAVLAKFSKEYATRNPEAFVLAHFVGVSPGSTDIRRTLLRLCRELKQQFALADDIPTDYYELRRAFPELLRKAGTRARTVLFIDALNQLDESHSATTLDWLPHLLPPGLALIVSTLEGGCLTSLRRRRPSPLEVSIGPLTHEERKEIVRLTLWTYRKRLDERADNNQLGALLSKRDSKNPLYLRVACEEFRVFGNFEQVTERITSLPDGVEGLFEHLLERVERDQGAELVTELLSLLLCARGGLFESELLELLAQPGQDRLPQARWAALYRSLKFYLRPPGEQGEGALDFFHQQLAEAARRRYFITPQSEAAAHQRLAAYFWRLVDPLNQNQWALEYPRGLSELPYHLLKGELHTELFHLARDESFLRAQAQAFPDDPNLQMDTLQQALEGAARIDDAAGMAEFLLIHAHRLTELTRESPLAALRAGNLNRAWELADLHDAERSTLWHLLLAWELSGAGQTNEARVTIERILPRELPKLSGWQGKYTYLLLSEISNISEEAVAVLQQRLLATDDARGALLLKLIARDHLTAALETARSIEDNFEQSKALGKIAVAKSKAGDFTNALILARSITERVWRDSALKDIAIVLALGGNFTNALETAHIIECVIIRAEAVAGISVMQAILGEESTAQDNFASALETVHGHYHRHEQALTLKGIAVIQAQVGKTSAARMMFAAALKAVREMEKEITVTWSLFLPAAAVPTKEVQASALKDIAVAQAQAGDLKGGLKTARNIRDTSKRIEALKDVAEVRGKAGDFRDAFVTARSIGDKKDQALILAKIAVAQARVEEQPTAQETLADALKLANSIGNVDDRLSALAKIAISQAAAGERLPARDTMATIIATGRGIKVEKSGVRRTPKLEGREAQNSATEEHPAARDAWTIEAVQVEKDEKGRASILEEIAALQKKVAAAEAEWNEQGAMLGGAGSGYPAGFAEFVGDMYEHHKGFLKHALVKIAEAQLKLGNFNSAVETVCSIQDEKDRAPVLKEMVAALKEMATIHMKVGENRTALSALAVAAELVSQSARSDKAIALSEVAVMQAKTGGESAARDAFAFALETARNIKSEEDRAATLSHVAVALVAAGCHTQAVQTAETILTSREQFLPDVAAALVEAKDKEQFKHLLIPCAHYPDAAYRMCGLLSRLYPESTNAITEMVAAQT